MATNNALNNNLTNCSNLPVPGGLSATGTPSATTFLRGDGTWNVPATGGTINSGLINQLAWYAAAGTTLSGLTTANNGILVTSAGGVPSISNTVGAGLTMPSITFNSTTGVVGTTTNDAAAAGSVGEYVTSAVTSPVGISNNTATNITSISLTAGDWDVWGNYTINTASTTVLNQILGWISSASASLPPDSSTIFRQNWGSTGISFIGSGVPASSAVVPQRFSLSGTTTIYLSAFATFTTSTANTVGFLSARRRR